MRNKALAEQALVTDRKKRGEAIDPSQVGQTLTAAAGFAAAGALLLLAARWRSRRSLGRQPA